MDGSPSKAAVVVDHVELLALILVELRALRRDAEGQRESVRAIRVLPPFTNAEAASHLGAKCDSSVGAGVDVYGMPLNT